MSHRILSFLIQPKSFSAKSTTHSPLQSKHLRPDVASSLAGVLWPLTCFPSCEVVPLTSVFCVWDMFICVSLSRHCVFRWLLMFTHRLSVFVRIPVNFVYGYIIINLTRSIFGLVFHRSVVLFGGHGFKCCLKLFLIQTHWNIGYGGWFFKSCDYHRLTGGAGFGCFM